MRLKDPYALLLLIVIVPMVWMYLRSLTKTRPALIFSDLSPFKKITPSWRVRFRHSLFTLRIIGIILLAIALARPQFGQSEDEVSTEGVDIMLLADVSFSMKALDFQPKNRLFVAKETLKEFVKKRNHDRIGLVIYAKRAYTKCPLTLDYGILSDFIEKTDFEDFGDATAIGTAIATAANRIKDSRAKSKIIILLTDGANNFGDIAPLAAAKATGELGIRIYTIGIGKEGQVPYPMEMINQFTGQVVGTQIQMMQSDIDEPLLADIAQVTKGRFFRAQNTETLKEIFSTIDKLEKTVIKTKSYTTYSDRFYVWLFAGIALLFVEIILGTSVFRRIP